MHSGGVVLPSGTGLLIVAILCEDSATGGLVDSTHIRSPVNALLTTDTLLEKGARRRLRIC
jgi:hypothetical protein